MIDLFELVPTDITDVFDVTMRNRWYEDGDRRRKARTLTIKHSDLGETIVPMKWNTETRSWVEDTTVSRVTFAGLNGLQEE